jgi:hypothetical protein
MFREHHLVGRREVMENFVSNALVQAASDPQASGSFVYTFWNWGFWIGFLVGVAGSIVSLFMKSPDRT